MPPMNRFEQLDSKTDRLCGKVDELNISFVQLKEKVKSIEQRLTSTERRINVQAGWFLGILCILVTGVLGILSKIVFFPNS